MYYYICHDYPEDRRFYGTWAEFNRIRLKGSWRDGTIKNYPPPKEFAKNGICQMFHDTISERFFAVHATGSANEGRKLDDGRWQFMMGFYG